VNKFRDHARTVIEHHFGKAGRIKYLSGGHSNFVFSFSTPDGNFIIRISPDRARIHSFIKEQWVVAAARKAGVPAPEILEVGTGEIQFPYMLSRSTDGVEATDHPRRNDIVAEMGRLAATVNSIPTKGFGQTFDWSDNKLSINKTFEEWVEKEYDLAGKLGVLEKHKMLTAQKTRKLKRIFSAAASEKTRPRLNHSDLRLKNVIADENGKINAIIDWEGAISNIVPAWELSIALHDLGIDQMQLFMNGYGLDPKKVSDLMPLIRAFNITNYAQAVQEIAASGNKPLLEHYRLRLAGGLDLYSI
jgi:aminoglycoside phosphotransferase (APT) family kinase protein